MRDGIDHDKSVFDNIADGHDMVTIGTRSVHVLGYLKNFLFSPQKAKAPVKDLSGGEKNRLLLAKLFTRPANILVLDEPTNDLDTDTLEMLELMLSEFDGTLLVVSHDRVFLNNVVTSVLAFDEDGQVRGYQVVTTIGKLNAYGSESRGASQINSASCKADGFPKTSGLSLKQRKRLAELPDQLDALEKQIEKAQTSLSDPTLFQSDIERFNAIVAEQDSLQTQYDNLFNNTMKIEDGERTPTPRFVMQRFDRAPTGGQRTSRARNKVITFIQCERNDQERHSESQR